MRKPLLALGLVVTTGFGAFPVANAMAASPPSLTLSGSPPQLPSSASSASSNPHATRAVSGADIVRTAMKYLGYPYTATGNSPQTGFSCIGFVSYVYRQNGIPLPGDLSTALAYAPQVSFSNLEPGDIMFFQNTVWPGLSHAAIYIGGGKFVHAEYYGKGVRITSFYNDASDGNYWPAKYMTANRPWTGAAVGSVVPTVPPAAGGTPSSSTSSVQTTSIPNLPASTVTASSGLYMRSGPSKSSASIQVLAPGTTVYVISRSGNWVQIQLSDGTKGWVNAKYISSTAKGTTVSVGNPTSPSAAAKPVTRSKKPYITVKATGLNVHSAPSTSAAVVASAYKGQKLTILGYSNGWYKVRMPDGTIGWVTSTYVAAHRPAHRTTGTSQAAGPSHTTAAALNVRSGPSLSDSVVTIIPVGGSYQILGWTNGWARVRLPNGSIGWVSGTVIGGGASSPTYKSKSRSTARSSTGRSSGSAGYSYTHRLTAGVRVHTGANVGSRVIGLAAAGSKVAVLGFRNGWTLVRLRNGRSGYVLGMYVR